VHVIMTFFPDCEAELIQAKGRVARQGNPGFYQEILLLSQLVEEFDVTAEQIEAANNIENGLSALLLRQRDAKHQAAVRGLMDDAKAAKVVHDITVQYQQALLAKDSENAKKILLKLNRGLTRSKPFHMILALDDSGSMHGEPWDNLIDAVAALLGKRIALCLASHYTCEDVITIINHSHNCEVMCRARSIHDSPEKTSRFRSGGNNFKIILDTCRQEFQNMDREDYVPVLLFMSDGGSNDGEPEMQSMVAEMPEIVVKTIGFSSGCDQAKMQRLADLGHGTYHYGEDAVSLKSEFQNISHALSSQPLH